MPTHKPLEKEPKLTPPRLGCLVIAAVLLTSACSSDSGEQTPEPAATVIEIMGDWPTYDSLEALAADSIFAVQGIVTASVGTWLAPTYEGGDDPELNPQAGTGHTPSAEELAASASPITLFSVEITDALDSAFSATEIIQVSLPGGIIDGFNYQVPSVVPLEIGTEYLFFIWGGDDVHFALPGVIEGAFARQENGQYMNSRGLIATGAEAVALIAGELSS